MRFSTMDATITHLASRLDKMAHLAGRVTAAFILMAGLPRVFHSGMYHFLASGLHGNSPGSPRSSSSSGSASSSPQEWYDLHKAVMEDRRREREEERAYFEQARSQSKTEKEAERAAEEQYFSQLEEKKKAAKEAEKEKEKTFYDQINQENFDRRKAQQDELHRRALDNLTKEMALRRQATAQLSAQLTAAIQQGQLKDTDPEKSTKAEKILVQLREAEAKINAEVEKVISPSTAEAVGPRPAPEVKGDHEKLGFKSAVTVEDLPFTGPPALEGPKEAALGTPSRFASTPIPRNTAAARTVARALAAALPASAPTALPFLTPDASGLYRSKGGTAQLGNTFQRVSYDVKTAFNWLRGRDARGTRELSPEKMAGRDDFFKNIDEKFNKIQRTAVHGFLGGTALIGATAGAGAPDALGLLLNSFKLLAAQVGQTLVPYLVQAAVWVQEMFQGFRSLSPAIRDTIGKVLFWGTALAGAIVIGSKILSPLLYMVTKVVAAMSFLGLGFNALTLKLGLLGGAIAAIATGFIRNKQMKDQITDIMEHANNPENETELADQAQKNKPEWWKSFKNQDAEEKKKDVQQLEREEARLKDMQERMSTGDFTNTAYNLPLVGDLMRAFGKGGSIGSFDEDALKGINDPALLRFHKGKLEGKSGTEIKQEVSEEYALKKGQRLAAQRELGLTLLTPEKKLNEEGQSFVSRFLMGISSTKAQPQYGGVEDAYKKIQLEVLGKDPLTRMLDQINRESLQKMLDTLRDIKVINQDQYQLYQEQLGMDAKKTSTTA